MARTLAGVALGSTLLLFPARVTAQNWPQFRGPEGACLSAEKGLPVEWSTTKSPTKNIAWKVEVPGVGWSSPIVWGARIFLTTAVPLGEEPKDLPKKGLYFGGNRPPLKDTVYRWEVHCLDAATGKTLWRETAVERKPYTAIQLKDSYASPTPATDGERVYSYFGTSGLFCHDLAGKLVWRKDLGKFKTQFGWASSSPVLDGSRLFVLCDNETKSFLLAVDSKTGDDLWRAQRDEKSSWGTPFVWRTPARVELLTCAKRVRSYDPASGKLLWSLEGMSLGVCTTPTAGLSLLYVSSGGYMFGDFRRPLYAIRPGATGDITLKGDETSSESVAWLQQGAGPYIPSPLLLDDSVYVLYDQGFFACFDAKTGKPVYPKQRIERDASGFTASPWAYEGKIFCLSEDGDTFVIQAGREFKVTGKNSIGEMCMATPAIAKGSLFLRGMKHLYCIRS
jgi:outer membrane protein assembly factor BamB